MLTGVYPDASDYEQRLADDAAVPARLRAVIGYACAFEPSKRPQSVQEFRQALFSQSNPPIPNASSANPPSTRTTNGSASASRLFRRLHLSKRAIVLWSIAGAALIIAAIAGGIVLAGQLGIIGRQHHPIPRHNPAANQPIRPMAGTPRTGQEPTMPMARAE